MFRSTPVALASIVSLLVVAAATGATLPVWAFADLPGIGPANWSEVKTDGDHTYRLARADARAEWRVPIWWGKTFRPPENTVYTLRLLYKDVITVPAVFEAHAGISTYFGYSEIHRFGGAGDGKWKTADIPLSWDLICRKNVPGDITELGITAPADLPVESITVSMAGANAADHYFAETRAWIAKAQAGKRTAAELGAKQKPVLPGLVKNQPIVPYVRNYLSVVWQNSAPQAGEASASLKLRMARNEYESAAFGVYANGQALKNATYTVSTLTGKAGVLAAKLDMRTVEYAVVKKRGRGQSGFRTFPQRLWPMYPVDIPAGQSHWFWVTVNTLGATSTPGLYSGVITVTANNTQKAALPIEVEVLPVSLPTMQQMGLSLGSCLSGLVPHQDLKTLAMANHTGMDLWFGGVQPQMKISGEAVELDYTYIDDFMARARQCGMTHMMWFFGGNPYGFPDTMNLERDLYRKEATGQPGVDNLRREYIAKLNAAPKKVLPRVRPRFVNFVRQTAQHAKANDWPLLILHPFDEPAKWVQSSAQDNSFAKVCGTGPWIKDHFKDAAALIREGAKGFDNVLVGGDMHHAVPSMTFMDDVDVFCTNAIHEDQQLGAKVRASGTQFWQYSGSDDQTSAHRPRYTFGFYFAAYDSVGSLIWAYNTLPRFDTTTADGWGWGWYTPFGTVYGPFLPGVREGFDDRRWVAAYTKQVVAKDPAARKLLDTIYTDAIAQRSRGGRDTVSDFYAEINRLDKLDEWRNQLINAVVAATKEAKPKP